MIFDIKLITFMYKRAVDADSPDTCGRWWGAYLERLLDAHGVLNLLCRLLREEVDFHERPKERKCGKTHCCGR